MYNGTLYSALYGFFWRSKFETKKGYLDITYIIQKTLLNVRLGFPDVILV